MWGKLWAFACDEGNVQSYELSENHIRLFYHAWKIMDLEYKLYLKLIKINGSFAVYLQLNWQDEPMVSRF